MPTGNFYIYICRNLRTRVEKTLVVSENLERVQALEAGRILFRMNLMYSVITQLFQVVQKLDKLSIFVTFSERNRGYVEG